jgi:hypothetical protein
LAYVTILLKYVIKHLLCIRLFIFSVLLTVYFMKAKLYVLLFPVLLFFCLPALAQRDSIPLKAIIEKSNKVSEAYPIEKVYLHLDKPYYAVGDTIWFKGYITVGLHQPSALSKIVYVDVISSRDSVTETLMLPVKNGTAVGSLVLSPDRYKQDNYHVKAYTKWMGNFDQAYFFNKTISVGNAINNQMYTVISYKRSVVNNIPRISASIIYKDPEGLAYFSKKVTWTVNHDGEEIAKGKGTTNANGQVDISFDNTNAIDLSAAVLNTTLDVGGRKALGQSYPLKAISSPTDIQFFPEGGSLVNGLQSRVAIKAIQPNGLGINYTATVTDNTGANVATFTARNAGMGAFAITPQAGKTYKANVIFADGVKESYDLPKSQASGFVFSINGSDTSKILMRLSVDSIYLKKNLNKTYYILGKCGSMVCYAAQIKLTSQTISAFIPSNKFPTGVIQLSLLANTGQALSERVVFIYHKDQLSLSVSSDKPLYTKRKKVTLNIGAKYNLAPAQGGDLSLAVIDESRIPVDENAETTILSHLLLTSELKGYIEKPNHYFKKVTTESLEDIDLLMLTQGYRRFTYKEALNDRYPTIHYFPEQGVEITGILRNTTGMPVKGGTVTLQIPDKFYTTRTTSDTEGKFKFANLVFADSAKVIVSAKGNYNAKNLMVTVDGISYPGLTGNPNYPDERLNIDTIMVSYLQNSKKIYDNSRTLKEVVIEAKAIVKVASHLDYPSLTGLSTPDHLVKGENFKGCNVMINCLQTMAMGVTYDVNTTAFYVTRDFNAGRKIPMAIYVRGMPVDVSFLNSINPSELESVEIFLKDDLGLVNRSNQTNGVLVINTKTAPVGQKITMAELEELIPQANVAKLSPKGYNVPKVFYSPKYTVANSGFGPDLRTTLYWNPRIYTDAAGKATVDFYSADNKATYRVVVEGIDKDGNIGRAIYRFRVE